MTSIIVEIKANRGIHPRRLLLLIWRTLGGHFRTHREKKMSRVLLTWPSLSIYLENSSYDFNALEVYIIIKLSSFLFRYLSLTSRLVLVGGTCHDIIDLNYNIPASPPFLSGSTFRPILTLRIYYLLNNQKMSRRHYLLHHYYWYHPRRRCRWEPKTCLACYHHPPRSLPWVDHTSAWIYFSE